jgi:hypothetical protein
MAEKRDEFRGLLVNTGKKEKLLATGEIIALIATNVADATLT